MIFKAVAFSPIIRSASKLASSLQRPRIEH
nr:MAG TPA: hypothetical protein [Caudoviricetes sp.]